MGDAEVLAQLRQKDSEKNSVSDDILKIQEQLEESCVGIVTISITEIKKAVDAFNHFEFFIEENPSSLVLVKEINSEVTFPLKKKTSMISISLREIKVEDIASTDSVSSSEGSDDPADEKPPASIYKASFDCSLLPDDTFIAMDVDATAADGSICILHLKASYDYLESKLKSKQLELLQLEASIEEIKASSKKAMKSTTAAKKKNSDSKGTKKSKKILKTNQSSVDEEGDDDTNTTNSSISKYFSLQSFQAGLIDLAVLSITQRSYILFAVASTGIYFYGEYASV